jgi:hypothetical protein
LRRRVGTPSGESGLGDLGHAVELKIELGAVFTQAGNFGLELIDSVPQQRDLDGEGLFPW